MYNTFKGFSQWLRKAQVGESICIGSDTAEMQYLQANAKGIASREKARIETKGYYAINTKGKNPMYVIVVTLVTPATPTVKRRKKRENV